MLTELCAELRNYFLRDAVKDIHYNTYTIADGSIESLPFLLDGQYYRIIGSVFNDGVHKYGDVSDTLADETFTGSIWAMAVPPAVIALADEIEAWRDANSAALASPYQSESYGGYSYTLKSGRVTQSGSDGLTWQSQFAKQLSRWRRISNI